MISGAATTAAIGWYTVQSIPGLISYRIGRNTPPPPLPTPPRAAPLSGDRLGFRLLCKTRAYIFAAYQLFDHFGVAFLGLTPPPRHYQQLYLQPTSRIAARFAGHGGSHSSRHILTARTSVRRPKLPAPVYVGIRKPYLALHMYAHRVDIARCRLCAK